MRGIGSRNGDTTKATEREKREEDRGRGRQRERKTEGGRERGRSSSSWSREATADGFGTIWSSVVTGRSLISKVGDTRGARGTRTVWEQPSFAFAGHGRRCCSSCASELVSAILYKFSTASFNSKNHYTLNTTDFNGLIPM
jgi:hypothetical protein